MADETTATSHNPQTFSPAPPIPSTDNQPANISSQIHAQSQTPSTSIAHYDTDSNVEHLQGQQPTSQRDVVPPIDNVKDTETSLPSQKPTAACAAISQTVDITNSLSDNRLSQGYSSNDTSSRPTTASRSHFTTGSRSQGASIRNPAFFHPMSSQRLQAQRGARPGVHHSRDTSFESDDENEGTTRANSLGTATEVKIKREPEGLTTQYFDDGMTQPESRGSDVTDRPTWTPKGQATNRGLINGNMRHEAARSVDTFPDKDQSQKSADPEKRLSPGPDHINRSRSPKSLVSALKRRSDQDGTKSNGHEKLSSQSSASLKKSTPHKSQRSLGKNWEYFDGNTLFFLGGRLETAKSKPIAIGTAALLVVPAVLWFAFCAPWLWHNVSPALPVIFAYLFFVTMSSFLHGCFSDPGILPRNLHPFPPEDPTGDALALGPPTTAWIRVVPDKHHPTAFEVPTKYYHHCVWLNNCVGRRNYRYFYAFVGTGAVISFFMLGASVAQIAIYKDIHDISFRQALSATAANGVAMFLFLYGMIAVGYPLSLWGYHNFLITRGLTTREYLFSNKFRKEDRHRPFDQRSIWRSLVVVICRPRGPSYMDFKKPYQEGDQRFGDRRGFWRKEPANDYHTSPGQLEMQQLDANGGGFQGPDWKRIWNGPKDGASRS